MLSDAALPVPASLASLLAWFAPLFTAPSFRTFTMLACGFLAHTGKRTVCGMVPGRDARQQVRRLATTPAQSAALLGNAVAVLEARAALLAAAGKRTWEISPDMPALIVLIDEYAELADDAAGAMADTDSIARLGRAVAVTLIAATQRPTQKAMGQGAVRSQMDLRICFRVREPRDVNLVLGQGMLRAGWDAHNLNAPGKFLVSVPGHDTPKRARAYLLTDQVVTETAARYANSRPGLDAESRRAIRAANYLRDSTADGPAGDIQVPEVSDSAGDRSGPSGADEALWLALCLAPDEGTDVGELLRLTGMSRPTLYRRLAAHAKAGRAIQVSRGRWRAVTIDEPPR